MRRWLILLAVMQSAILLLYLPGIDGEGFWDTHRWTRAWIGMGSYAVLVVCWAVALRWLVRARGRLDRQTLAVVLGGALVLVVSLWALPPTYSNDVFRYRWEGISSTQGYSPYLLKPDANARMRETERELYRSVHFGHLPSIYPPFAQVLFAVNAMLGGGMLGWRVILLAFEVLLLISCHQLMRRARLPSGWLVAIALCPLLLMETFLDGHMELIGVALTVSAIATLQNRQWWISAMLFAMAVNVKYLWPALVAFLMLGELYRQRRLIAGSLLFGGTLVALWVPFLRLGAGAPDNAWRLVVQAPVAYLTEWGFNATLFRLLSAPFDWVGHPNWAKLLALLIIVGLMIALIVRHRWRMELRDVCLVLAAALVLAPTSYPWYFLWLLPGLLVVRPSRMWKGDAPTPWRGPLPWVVVWIAAVPALHEHLWLYFRWGHSESTPGLPWIIAAMILPMLAAAWYRRLREPPLLPGRDCKVAPGAAPDVAADATPA